MLEGLFLLVLWIVPVVLSFFLIYWAVRLAIRHEKQWVPTTREAGTPRRRPRPRREPE
ncbi:hypothetical protein OUY22_04555 [Nonomuraea sp. MCN248]|uniref:Uncharacterized protein n=1 Tax=Nonomuraea corallina TaxID=2989783 RepID=A0ABT4S664_9ACTN|nr:hypothetical protein [Nonomuraea corallina]MDA0632679.1 hypothetical protein [Nonomuraea corallina]